MVWLFDYSPKLADLQRIFFYTFENGLFPYFKMGLPWGIFRGKNFSKMAPTILTGHIMKVYDEKWTQNFFEISKCLILQIQSQLALKEGVFDPINFFKQ